MGVETSFSWPRAPTGASTAYHPPSVDLRKAGDLPEYRTNTKAATVSVVCSSLPNCGTQVTEAAYSWL